MLKVACTIFQMAILDHHSPRGGEGVATFCEEKVPGYGSLDVGNTRERSMFGPRPQQPRGEIRARQVRKTALPTLKRKKKTVFMSAGSKRKSRTRASRLDVVMI